MVFSKKWYGKQMEELAQRAINEASQVCGEVVLTDAKKRAPIDTGTLRRSGMVSYDNLPDETSVYNTAKTREAYSKKQPNAKNQAVTKTYVSFNTPYAHKQHEDLNANHQDGEAKYLEKAFNAKSKLFEKILTQHIEKVLNNG